MTSASGDNNQQSISPQTLANNAVNVNSLNVEGITSAVTLTNSPYMGALVAALGQISSKFANIPSNTLGNALSMCAATPDTVATTPNIPTNGRPNGRGI